MIDITCQCVMVLKTRVQTGAKAARRREKECLFFDIKSEFRNPQSEIDT